MGNLTERADRNGRVIEYAYDRLDRNTTEKWFADALDVTADRTLSFSYDLVGRLRTSSDVDHSYEMAYDALDRRIDYVNITGLSGTVVLRRQYDLAGNRRRLSATFGLSANSPDDFVNLYQYDHLNRLAQVTQQGAGGTGDHAVAEKRVDLAYDLSGQLDWVKRYSSLDTSSAVAASDYTWDSSGRISRIEHKAGAVVGPDYAGTLLAGYGYSWKGITFTVQLPIA